jgi:hypothetical protein
MLDHRLVWLYRANCQLEIWSLLYIVYALRVVHCPFSTVMLSSVVKRIVESRYVVPGAFSQSLINSYLGPQLVAALMLQHERSTDRVGGSTIGGSMLRRGQATTFPERLDITERAAAGQSDPEIATTLGCELVTFPGHHGMT